MLLVCIHTEKGDSIFVLTCVNAEGTVLLFYGIMKVENLKQKFCDGMPTGAQVRMSQKSAYVNTALMK